MMKNDLCKRLFDFAVDTIQVIKKLPMSPENKIIRYQLAKSSTSSGANYEEAQAGSSKADFANKIKIALKEMRESNYWLRIIIATNEINEPLTRDIKLLIDESEQLKKILAKIIITAKTNT
ncbi:four helix bundle protein [Marinilabiliaceae bacterium JC017]|nr:four helix bundle protein [Marinilabiliaceae bacterium JC017]